MNKITKFATIFLLSFLITACGSTNTFTMPMASQVVAPTPIEGNGGEFMSPFTSDGVVAPWVEKAIDAKTGAAVGSAVGAYAGQKLMENIPFVGGWLGQKAGDAAGREIALQMAGGYEYIKETSDLSFNTLDELSVWMYATHSTHKHYQQALESMKEIYPDLKSGYMQALIRAPRKQQ